MLHVAAEQLQNPLVPDLTELIIGAITFGIIFFALWKVLIPRLSKTLEERTDKIEGGLQRAEETQAEADATPPSTGSNWPRPGTRPPGSARRRASRARRSSPRCASRRTPKAAA